MPCNEGSTRPLAGRRRGLLTALIAQVDSVRRFHEDGRRWNQQLRQRPGVVCRVRCTFGNRDLSCVDDERGTFRNCDSVDIHQEAVDSHRVGWRLFRVVLIGSHREGPSANPCHPGGASNCHAFGRLTAMPLGGRFKHLVHD
jgi:hypothetical protein